jgi:hypothetical protein
MIQSGNGNWIINSHPLGTDFIYVSRRYHCKNVGFDLGEGFLFGGLSPPNEKITSLCARRLCGEISILGKHVKAYLIKGG